jgi:hypothetical protein
MIEISLCSKKDYSIVKKLIQMLTFAVNFRPQVIKYKKWQTLVKFLR